MHIVLYAAFLTVNYNITFYKGDARVDKGYTGDVLDVTLSVPEGTLQEREIFNFNEDMSDIEFEGASYVEGSLTNRQDAALFENGFLKAFAVREGQRVSLSSEVRFQIELGTEEAAVLTCKAQSFTVYDPATGVRVGNQEQAFVVPIGRHHLPIWAVVLAAVASGGCLVTCLKKMGV